MSKVNRNAPARSSASESRYTLEEFDREFSDDAACLDFLVGRLYPDGITCPKCQKVTKHYRDAGRPSYSCEFCGHHEHPLAGTIFQDSATSLRLWFYAMYLMASTRCGISAKQLERELGVTYKTAWRMFNKIRSLLTDETGPMDGTVEVDESFIGGLAKWKNQGRPVGGGTGGAGKTTVIGVVQRGRGGKKGTIAARVVPSTGAADLLPFVQEKVLPASWVYTDEWRPYQRLSHMGYHHARVHHAQKVYVMGDVHTNTIEGFWSLLKGGISGVYRGVSKQHLQAYLDEYAFRYSNRGTPGRGMFDAFLNRISKVSKAAEAPAPPAA